MKPWVVWVAAFFVGGGGLWCVNGELSQREQSTRYEAAPACAEGRSARDCRSRETATITEKTLERSHRSRTYRLEFHVTDGNVRAMVSSAQYDAASKGESLDIERWDGYVTRIYRNGRPEAVVQTPRRRTPMLVSGIGSIVVALGLIWLALRGRN
jgi:hypothetical protein